MLCHRQREPSKRRLISETMIKMMRQINPTCRLIVMGDLVHFSIPLHMRSSLTITERILCPWEGRYMLKSKINLVIFPLSNDEIDAMKKDQLCAEILQIRIK